VPDDKPRRLPLPAAWQGIEAVRLSGATNMLDRPLVVRIAGELGFPEAARWIETHPKGYCDGIGCNRAFQGVFYDGSVLEFCLGPGLGPVQALSDRYIPDLFTKIHQNWKAKEKFNLAIFRTIYECCQ